MCLLDALNPCKICNLISAVVLCATGVFAGGYVGKFMYLHANKDMSSLNWAQVLTSDGFWRPDIIFWICGLSFVTLVFCVIGAINYLLTCIGVTTKRTLYFLVCDNCCWTCCVTTRTSNTETIAGSSVHHLSLEQYAEIHATGGDTSTKSKKSKKSINKQKDIWRALGDQV